MRCNHCKANVEKAIMTLDGAISVAIELSSGAVEIEGNVLPDDIYSAIQQLGFDVVSE